MVSSRNITGKIKVTCQLSSSILSLFWPSQTTTTKLHNMFCYVPPTLITDIYENNPQSTVVNGTNEPILSRPKSAEDGDSVLSQHQHGNNKRGSFKRVHSFSSLVNSNNGMCVYYIIDTEVYSHKNHYIIVGEFLESISSSSFSPPNVTILRDVFDVDYEVKKPTTATSSVVGHSGSLIRSNSRAAVYSNNTLEDDKSDNQTITNDSTTTTNNDATTTTTTTADTKQTDSSSTTTNQPDDPNTTARTTKKELVFTKQTINLKKRTSALTEGNAAALKKPRTAIIGATDHPKHRIAIVYIQDTQKKVSVNVSEKTVGIDIVRQATNSENYTLHVATETSNRGVFSIDNTYPALQPNTPILNLSIPFFILVPNKRRESNALMNANRSSLLLKERKRGTLEDVILEIYKTNSSTAIINLTSDKPIFIPVAPDLMMKDLQKVVAQKFEIDDKKFQLFLVSSDGKTKTIPKNYRDKTFRSLPGVYKFAYVKISATSSVYPEDDPSSPTTVNKRSANNTSNGLSGTESNGSNNTVEEDDLVLPFDIDAFTYTEFRVIKTNKFGVRQERKLGIDSQKISNMKLHSITSFLGLQSSKTKHPERPLETLTAVTPNPDNNKAFTLDFTDGETLYYETKTTVECAEVCKRLKYLLRLKKQEQNDSLLRRRSISIMALNRQKSANGF
jgi:hypothetical protein